MRSASLNCGQPQVFQVEPHKVAEYVRRSQERADQALLECHPVL
jgi:hypothetical protein